MKNLPVFNSNLLVFNLLKVRQKLTLIMKMCTFNRAHGIEIFTCLCNNFFITVRDISSLNFTFLRFLLV